MAPLLRHAPPRTAMFASRDIQCRSVSVIFRPSAHRIIYCCYCGCWWFRLQKICSRSHIAASAIRSTVNMRACHYSAFCTWLRWFCVLCCKVLFCSRGSAFCLSVTKISALLLSTVIGILLARYCRICNSNYVSPTVSDLAIAVDHARAIISANIVLYNIRKMSVGGPRWWKCYNK